MKTLKLSFIVAAIICLIAPFAEAKPMVTQEGNSKIQVYYFHNTRRCATCNAVESVTKEALKTQFPQQVADGVITFQSLNLEEEDGKIAAKKLEVNGQSLLFVSGNKKTDLTTAGFMNALTKPNKLKDKVKETVNSML